jgi:hypothetical protein
LSPPPDRVPYPAPTARPERPRAVIVAFWLWIASALACHTSQLPELIDNVRRLADPDGPSDHLPISLLANTVFIAVWLTAALGMRAGRRRALALLHIIGVVIVVSDWPDSGHNDWYSWITIIAAVALSGAAEVFMMHPGVTTYFRSAG